MLRKVRFVILVVALAVAVAAFSFAPFIQTRHASAATSIPNTTSTFRLLNVNAGRCIGIDSSGYAGDWTCTTHPDQTWHWGNSDGSGFFQLINGYGQCLGVQNASTALGARIKGGACNGQPDQYWSAQFGTVDYVLTNIPESNSNMVIGVQGASTSNGAELIQWTYNGSIDQDWTFA